MKHKGTKKPRARGAKPMVGMLKPGGADGAGRLVHMAMPLRGKKKSVKAGAH